MIDVKLIRNLLNSFNVEQLEKLYLDLDDLKKDIKARLIKLKK